MSRVVFGLFSFAALIGGQAIARSPPFGEYPLYPALLGNYDKTIRPIVDKAQHISVRLRSEIQSVKESVDGEEIRLRQLVTLSWVDQGLRWNTGIYADIAGLRFPLDRVWLPPLLVGDRPLTEGQDLGGLRANVSADGATAIQLQLNSAVPCRFDLSAFPFDEQECLVAFHSRELTRREMELEAELRSFESAVSSAKGSLEVLSAEVVAQAILPDTALARAQLRLRLRRPSGAYTRGLVLPVVLVVTLTLVGLFTPASVGPTLRRERLSLALVALLAIAVFANLSDKPLQTTLSGRSGALVVVECVVVVLGALVSQALLVGHHSGALSGEGIPAWLACLACLPHARPKVAGVEDGTSMGDEGAVSPRHVVRATSQPCSQAMLLHGALKDPKERRGSETSNRLLRHTLFSVADIREGLQVSETRFFLGRQWARAMRRLDLLCLLLFLAAQTVAVLAVLYA